MTNYPKNPDWDAIRAPKGPSPESQWSPSRAKREELEAYPLLEVRGLNGMGGAEYSLLEDELRCANVELEVLRAIAGGVAHDLDAAANRMRQMAERLRSEA